MSITAETAKAHANDPAVLCCRAEGGITIEPANLEDPAIFDELVDSLCPLTADNVEGFKSDDDLAAEEAPAEEGAPAEAAPAASVQGAVTTIKHGKVVISIKEGKDIYLELPI